MNEFYDDTKFYEGEKEAVELNAHKRVTEAIPYLAKLKECRSRMSDATLEGALSIVADLCKELYEEFEKRMAEKEKGDRANDRPTRVEIDSLNTY